MQHCVLNKQEKFGVKMLLHYKDIMIFVLGHFILIHPVFQPNPPVTFFCVIPLTNQQINALYHITCLVEVNIQKANRCSSQQSE